MPNPNAAPEWQKCLTLLMDPDVSEVEANGPESFFIKKAGKRLAVDVKLPSAERYLQGIEVGLIPHVRQIIPYKRDSYLFEGPLELKTENGIIRGRCHIVLPPAADHPLVTIAKKSTALATLDSIAERGSMSSDMLLFLKMAMRARLNIAFSGGTGAGKTTMLEACSKFIPNDTRVGVAEDTPELALSQNNVIYQHSVPWRPGMDANDVATLEWIVQQFQRQRIDRAIIGETRGREFWQFLVAANSGMDGSMTTIHADDTKQCLDKMSSFAMAGSDRQPVRSINKTIGRTIDIIVQLGILPDGRHKILEIGEITSMVNDREDASITANILYSYNRSSDMFHKMNQPTDNLRKLLQNRGVSPESVLAVPVGGIMKPHSTGMSNAPSAASRTGGLPRPDRSV